MKGRKVEEPGNSAPGSARWHSSRLCPRNATVTATSPVSVLVVHESGFRRLLHDSPEIQLKVLQTLADRAAENALH